MFLLAVRVHSFTVSIEVHMSKNERHQLEQTIIFQRRHVQMENVLNELTLRTHFSLNSLDNTKNLDINK